MLFNIGVFTQTGSGLMMRIRFQNLIVALFLSLAPFLLQMVSAQKQAAGNDLKASSPDSLKRENESILAEGMKYMMLDEPSRALPFFEKLILKKPLDPTAHYLSAQALLKLDKLPEAADAAKKAYSLESNNAFYAQKLADLYGKQKKYKESAEIYESLLSKDAGNVQLGLELAAVYVFSSQFEKAIQTYDRLEKSIGVTEEISFQKKQLYLRQNQLDKAIAEIKKLIASESTEAQYRIELAELYLANDKLNEAVIPLEEALKIDPDEAQAHILLADIYRRKGDVEKCNKELNLVFSNPNIDSEPKVRVLSGYLAMLGKNGDRTEAMSLSKKLIELHPKESKGYVLYADLLVQSGKKAEARDMYAKAARIDGSVYEVWGALLQLDGELNQIDSLLTHSEMALEVFPNQGMIWYSNGSANLMKRNFRKAVSALEESRKLLANNMQMAVAINAQLGDAYNGIGDHSKSDSAYELALKDDPNNDHVLNNYSYFLSVRKVQLDKALSMSEKLVRRHANNATYLDTHAWVLYMKKEYSSAKEYLEKAMSDSTNLSGTILEHYGDVLFKLGDKAKALENWRKAKQMGGAGETIDKKIATGTLYD